MPAPERTPETVAAITQILEAVKPLGMAGAIETLAGVLASVSGASCQVVGETNMGSAYVVDLKVKARGSEAA